jgi:hypothetical protein
MRTCRIPAYPCSFARLADEWLRLLHRHALEGFESKWRKRAEALWTGRMARESVLHGAGASRTGVDGGGTLVASSHVPDEVYEEARAQFNEKELSDLTLAVAAINAWNRLAIATRTEPGAYKVANVHEEKRAS